MKTIQDLGNNPFTPEKKSLDYDPKEYAAIYARVSTTKVNYSIESQIEKCTKKLHEHNLKLYKVYSEQVSAKQKHFYERKEFSKLINNLKAGMFKNLIVLRRDRLTRRNDDHITLRNLFHEYGVKVIFVNELDLNPSDNSYTSRFIDNILMAISSLEADIITSRTIAGIKNSTESDRYKSRRADPYGLSKTDDDNYELNPPQSDAVKEIFYYYADIDLHSINIKNTDYKPLIEKLNKIDPNANLDSQKIRVITNLPIYAQYKFKNGEARKISNLINNDKSTLDKSRLIKCSNITPLVEESVWEKAILNYYTLHPPQNYKPKKSYLFKNMINCSKCNNTFTLKDTKYICKKSCTCIEESKMIDLILSKIFFDLKDTIIKNKLRNEIKSINNPIKSIQMNLKITENNIRDSFNSYMLKPNKHNLDQIKYYQSQESAYKDNIAIYLDIKSKLKSYLSDIDSFILNLKNITNEDISYLKENIDKFNDALNSFIKNIEYDKEVNIEYSRQ